MKKIYLIGYFDDLKWIGEFLQELELVPESRLVETVKTMIHDGRICEDTITDNGYDVAKMDAAQAVEILKDDGYTVELYEIEE